MASAKQYLTQAKDKCHTNLFCSSLSQKLKTSFNALSTQMCSRLKMYTLSCGFAYHPHHNDPAFERCVFKLKPIGVDEKNARKTICMDRFVCTFPKRCSVDGALAYSSRL